MKRNTTQVVKFKKLCRALDLPSYVVVGILEMIWHMTAREAPRGDLGKLSNEEIAIGIDWEGDHDALVQALVDNKWLDESEKYRLIVHDWHVHADDATKKAVVRNGQTFCALETDCQDLSRNVATNPDLSRLPEPEPGTKPEPDNPPTPQGADGVVVDFDLQRGVEELYELMPPDKRSPNPGADKSRIKYCLMGYGKSPPAKHFEAVKAGVLRLIRCLDAGYDRKFIPGFRSFFELGDDAGWRGDWLPPSASESPPVAGAKSTAVIGQMLYGPQGEEVFFDAGQVAEQLASGWSATRLVKTRGRRSEGAAALAAQVLEAG